MKDSNRTNYVYDFTYSSAPGLREVFQCKYVTPEEALNRFKKLLSLTQAPFDFKIHILDEVTREESSFQVNGSVKEMLEKFAVFLETSTGFKIQSESKEELEHANQNLTLESMSNYEKMQIVVYASFRHGKFSSIDVAEIYESTFNEELPKSTASTYLARMWNNGLGHIERLGNRSGYIYRLRTELPEVQSEIQRAERLIGEVQSQKSRQ